jgi:hypothetical protein
VILIIAILAITVLLTAPRIAFAPDLVLHVLAITVVTVDLVAVALLVLPSSRRGWEFGAWDNVQVVAPVQAMTAPRTYRGVLRALAAITGPPPGHSRPRPRRMPSRYCSRARITPGRASGRCKRGWSVSGRWGSGQVAGLMLALWGEDVVGSETALILASLS